MTLRKRSVYWLGAAGLLLAVGAAIVLLTVNKSQQSATASSVKLSSAQQSRLERGLTAPSVAGELTVVAAEVRAPFMSRGQRLLPAGSRVRIEPATFKAGTVKTATVDAVLTGPHPARWQLLLINESGNWLLIGTRRLG